MVLANPTHTPRYLQCVGHHVATTLQLGKHCQGSSERDEPPWINTHTPEHVARCSVHCHPCSWASIAKGRHKGMSLRKWVKDMAKHTGQPPVKESAIQLMEKMLSLDPSKRCSALEAFRVGCVGVGVV